ncbi:PACE efflux transporter [Vibrio ponticus]|uniref:PACE efflux transporter n=1 Tax=Vibrio ponticus TaxID=265668 RepID=A0A3N3DT58_9VIBR|nr:PACE efflux transporter [Vibrio ponticus]ROV57576.1 PACE efflux transporter [Vibrio ponticus]
MTKTERIFHAVTFEMIMIALCVPLLSLIMEKEAGGMLAVSIGLSVTAMVWNYVYNLLVDNFFGADRAKRGVVFRIIHSLGFEGGLIGITVPVLAWTFGITLYEALLLEIGLVVFILLYTMAFNYLYDKTQPYKKIISYKHLA